MTTLRDTIGLAVEVGPPFEAGRLRLFPLFVTGASAPPYLAGPQAEAAGVITVTEHGDGAAVPELVLTASGELPLLLLEGETVLGVKQNRTLNVSILCPPRSPTVIPVSCVEAGRWGAVQSVSRSPRLSPTTLRAAKTRSVVDSVRTRASKRSDQHLVWDTVAGYAARRFLDRILTSPATEAPAVALGTEFHLGDDDITGAALVWEGAVVHLAAFGT